MGNWQGTKGTWKKRGNQVLVDNKTVADCENDLLPLFETNINASLIQDAGNTIQQCGLHPNELLHQRNKLLKFVKMIVDENWFTEQYFDNDALKLINEIENYGK